MSVLSDINITKGDIYTTMSLVHVGRFSDCVIKNGKLRWNLEEIILNAIKSCPLDKWPDQALNRVRDDLNIEKMRIHEVVHPFIDYIDQIEFYNGDELLLCVYGSRYKKEDPSTEPSLTNL